MPLFLPYGRQICRRRHRCTASKVFVDPLGVNMKQQRACCSRRTSASKRIYQCIIERQNSADSICEIGGAAWHPEQKSQASFCEVRHGFAGGALVGIKNFKTAAHSNSFLARI